MQHETDETDETDVTDATGAGGRRRGPRARWIVLAAVLGVIAFVLVWFEPQALFIDERVSDPVPVVAGDPTDGAVADETATDGMATEEMATDGAAPTTTVAPGPVELGGGDLVSIDHGTSGRVRVLELADGSRFVRLEGLSTDNGPAVRVYLSTNPAGGPEGAFDDEFVDLGELQGNLGDQNYAVPADVDPLTYASVVIWCERFDSAFGAADLMAS